MDFTHSNTPFLCENTRLPHVEHTISIDVDGGQQAANLAASCEARVRQTRKVAGWVAGWVGNGVAGMMTL